MSYINTYMWVGSVYMLVCIYIYMSVYIYYIKYTI